MKYTIPDALLIITALSTGIMASIGLLLCFLIWLIVVYHYRLEILPLLVWPYLNIQHYSNFALMASLICLTVSTLRYLKWRKSEKNLNCDKYSEILNIRKKLIFFSGVCSFASIGNYILYALWPWIYW